MQRGLGPLAECNELTRGSTMHILRVTNVERLRVTNVERLLGVKRNTLILDTGSQITSPSLVRAKSMNEIKKYIDPNSRIK